MAWAGIANPAGKILQYGVFGAVVRMASQSENRQIFESLSHLDQHVAECVVAEIDLLAFMAAVTIKKCGALEGGGNG